MYKIATWNVERPKKGTEKTSLAITKIKEVNADILVLTENATSISLTELYSFSVHSLAYERTPEEHWVSIFSKWQITQQIKTFDNYRTACAVIKAPFGDIAVFGTIIPYHQAGVSGVRYGNLGYKQWEYHEKDLHQQAKNWEDIIEETQIPLWVMGDFNQSRYNLQGYGTEKVRQILTNYLEKLDLSCVTEGDLFPFLHPDPIKHKIRNNIDHICIANNFIKQMKQYQVGAWDHFSEEGKYMSDHNGVFISFDI